MGGSVRITYIALQATFVALTYSEWVVVPKGLPMDNQNPKYLTLQLQWNDDSAPQNITLNLKHNDAVQQRLPIWEEVNGKPVQVGLADLSESMFYQDVHNHAAVSMAKSDYGRKLIGSFIMNGTPFTIEPYNPSKHKRAVNSYAHHIVTRSPEESGKDTDYRLPKEHSDSWEWLQQQNKLIEQWKAEGSHGFGKVAPTGFRRKRATQALYVELYIAVDYSLYMKMSADAAFLQWSNGVDDYVAWRISHLANEIDLRYRNIKTSAVFTISTKLSDLYISKSAATSTWTESIKQAASPVALVEAGRALDAFNAWRTTNSASLPKDDHFMLITGYDLYYGTTSAGFANTAVAGLATVGGICGSGPVSVNEFTTSTVNAHELGHNIGAQHDGDGNACTAADQYVMAPSSGPTTATTQGRPWYFSSCSITYFEALIAVLNRNSKNCLLNSGTYLSSWASYSTKLPGQIISVDLQCKMQYGSKYAFQGGVSAASQVCSQMQCADLTSGSYNWKGGALPYTTCGDKKWCEGDFCVANANAPAASPTCSLGESRAPVYNNYNTTCSQMTNGAWCYNGGIPEKCCATCPKYYKPWLGTSCLYGDKADWCSTLAPSNCPLNKAVCCEKCCVANAAAGISCTASATTTAPTTTTRTTTTTAPTTTTRTTTTTTPTTTTRTTTTTAPTTTTRTTTTSTTTRRTTTIPTTTKPTTKRTVG